MKQEALVADSDGEEETAEEGERDWAVGEGDESDAETK